MYFRYFIISLLLNKLESPALKDALCQVWLKLAQWFLRRRSLNFVNIFSLFLNYLPSEKGMTLHLNKEKGPQAAKLALLICLKLKIVEYV